MSDYRNKFVNSDRANQDEGRDNGKNCEPHLQQSKNSQLVIAFVNKPAEYKAAQGQTRHKGGQCYGCGISGYANCS